MENLKQFFQNTTVKITILVAMVLLSLLALLNVVVINNSEKAFISVIEKELMQRQDVLQELSPAQRNVLIYDLNGVERAKPLQEEFVDRFQDSLVAIAFVGVFMSFIIGFTLSQVLIQPLKRLRSGISKLKSDNYETMLYKTGTTEIDDLVEEFNKLSIKLQQTEELRKDLISDASHELKTPLTILKGQLEALKDGMMKSTQERYGLLLDQVHRLSQVVDRMQEFTRLRGKSYQLEKTKYNLFDQLKMLKKEYKAELKDKNIKLNIEISEKTEIKADKHLVKQVFENLLTNSIRYSKASSLRILMEEENILVKDDGIGIPEDKIQNIFERFYRIDKSRSRETGGLGLGLAIVKEIVEAHGWNILARNDDGLEIKIKRQV